MKAKYADTKRLFSWANSKNWEHRKRLVQHTQWLLHTVDLDQIISENNNKFLGRENAGCLSQANT